MESKNTIKNSQFSKKLTKTQRKIIKLLLILSTLAILATLLLRNSHSSSKSINHNHQSEFHLHSFIKKACSETLYSTLCHSTLSNTTTAPKTFLDILVFVINRTDEHLNETRTRIVSHFKEQDMSSQEQNALQDCMEMLDQTSYELEKAIDSLRSRPSSTRRSYGNIKTLLSAAMTNENTCINGFLDLEELDLDNKRKGRSHRQHLQSLLTPISNMISNSLALIKHVENKKSQESVKKPRMMIARFPRPRFRPHYGRNIHRRRKKVMMNLRPHVTVASDGLGNYSSITEAIAMAPNMSTSTYVIKIMSGIYEENVLIPREKINIMFVGDGMNSTIITGSRSFADGFSTFATATLTVVGDKFLARDLTIRNTAPPEKHQAVALRVTSNAAFYRCEIISYQDTLYAHSLRQLYKDCTIQGTVDFIFGNAAAVFQNCRILVRKPSPGQRNMITAQGREDPNQNTGIFLHNCTIEAAVDFNVTDRNNFSTYLGRPWRNYSRTIVMNSYLGDLIHPRGWCEWDQYSSLDTVEYVEYMNFGPGSNTRNRITWPGYRKNCSEEMARQFTVEGLLRGADEWLESVLPLFSSL